MVTKGEGEGEGEGEDEDEGEGGRRLGVTARPKVRSHLRIADGVRRKIARTLNRRLHRHEGEDLCEVGLALHWELTSRCYVMPIDSHQISVERELAGRIPKEISLNIIEKFIFKLNGTGSTLPA